METLKNYLDTMFARFPETDEVTRAKTELWQMMEDKFNELREEGKSEDEARETVIAEFGDLDEVADTLGIATMLQTVEPAVGAKQETAQETVQEESPLKFGETMTGEQETTWQTTTENTDAKAGAWWAWHNAGNAEEESGATIYRYIQTALSVFWLTVTCIYLCWSFLTFHWWITWIIWPLAAVLHSVLKRMVLGDVSARNGKVYKSRLIAAVLDSYWPCVVFVYFVVSFVTRAWAISWLIFVIAPFVRNVLKNMSTEEAAS